MRRVSSLWFHVLGIAVFCASWLDPRFRDAEGAFAAPAVVPWAVAAGFIALGWFRSRGAARAGEWLALLIVGQAFVLQLVRAGPTVSYQHLRPFEETRLLWVPLIAIAAQTAIVAAASWPHLRKVSSWFSRKAGRWHLLLLVGFLFFASVKIAWPVTGFVRELLLASLLQVVQLANALLFCRALSGDAGAEIRGGIEGVLGPATEGDDPEPGGLDGFAWKAALWALACALVLSVFVYERHPHVPDEVVYLIHANYLAHGLLHMPVPPVPLAFEVDLMMLDGDRWFCPVPPGWPVILAIGARFGVPWLVNPLLGAGSILLAYLFVREIASRRTARITVLFMCVSPWFMFLNMSFMTHSLTLFCSLLAALGIPRARRTGSAAWTALGGVGLGFVALIRPLEGLGLATVLGLWGLGFGVKRLKLLSLASLVLVSAGVCALVLPYNKYLTGSATKYPIMDYVDKVYGPGKNDIGFGPDRGLHWGGLDPFPGHGLRDVLVNTSSNTFATNTELLGWGTGSLWVIALYFLCGRKAQRERWLYWTLALFVGLSSLYWFSGGPDFGARYWYMMLVPCLLLTARALSFFARETDGGAPGRVLGGAVGLCFASLVVFVPWRAVDKYHNYRGMRPDVRDLAAEHDFGRSLVLIRGRRHPDYASAIILNPLDLEADAPIYARDRGPETRKALLEHYADRPVWVLAGPSLTGAGFEVVDRFDALDPRGP